MNSALILAGGLGTRLRPLTYAIPKPLLPIGEKPILEIIIEHLKKYGINKIYISVNYKKELIKSYFQDGKSFNVEIQYLEEDKRLGTAGPIKLLEGKIQDNFFIINGDIYTDIDILNMYDFHKLNNSLFTIATRKYEIEVPYGVLEKNDSSELKSFKEKPKILHSINSGIYICNKSIIKLINKNEFIDMPDLWKRIRKNENIYLFDFDSIWVDIGKMDDYINIQEMILKNK